MYYVCTYQDPIYTILTCANLLVPDVTGVFGKHFCLIAFGSSSIFNSVLRVAHGFLLYSLKRDLIASETPAYIN